MVKEIVYALAIGGAIYGGIRADLKWLKTSVARLDRRIDEHLEGHK